MSLFNLRRIAKEDFNPKYFDLLDKLLYPLNQAIDSLNSGLNKSLTVAENMSAQESVITVTAPVTSSNPFKFKSTLNGPCRGMICIDAQLANSASSPPTSQPFFTQTTVNGQIVVTNITGLVAGSSYKLRVYCFTSPI